MIKDFKETKSWDINSPQRNEKAWTPPPVNFFKINVDGAIPSVEGHSGVGVIIRDWERKVVTVKCLPLSGRMAVEEMEAIAMEQGMILAKNLGLERTIFEGDSLQTIQAIEAKEVRSVIGHIVGCCLQIIPSFQEAKVRHISREGNKIAHELAQLAKQTDEEQVWTSSFPDWIEDMARAEGTS
ncbi:uncharacterized protein LOC112009757 [Quercus suber]|uniref:uncharacterized protein LOC112009757 n=1 Tax=Quercus suber TaxID=58331 RepID=UPI000CE23F8B|nr:uncharacterized protein LOC112009757 [Quercus suber]